MLPPPLKRPTPPNPALLEPPQDPWLPEQDAATLLGVKPGTLRMWRAKDQANRGEPDYIPKCPPYEVQGGRPRYKLSLLRHWLRTLPLVDGVPVFPDNRVKRHHELHRERMARANPSRTIP